MKTKSNEAAYDLPFILRFVEPLEKRDYDEDIAEHDLVLQSYSPQTQTSNVIMASGTSRTYSTTYTGLFTKRDDDRVSDD